MLSRMRSPEMPAASNVLVLCADDDPVGLKNICHWQQEKQQQEHTYTTRTSTLAQKHPYLSLSKQPNHFFSLVFGLYSKDQFCQFLLQARHRWRLSRHRFCCLPALWRSNHTRRALAQNQTDMQMGAQVRTNAYPHSSPIVLFGPRR